MASASMAFFDRITARRPDSTFWRFCGASVADMAGISKTNSDPSPSRLDTEIVPPMAVTRRLEMARPRPAPPCARVDVPSDCSNSSKMRSMSSSRRPGPVSVTVKHMRSVVSVRARATLTSTPPVSVNLMALPMRLSSTCLTLPGSAVIICGTSGSTWQPRPIFLAKARAASSSMTLSAISRSDIGCGSGSKRPASILE